MTTHPITLTPWFKRLTRGQISTITGLSADYCQLGCGEPTAKALAEAAGQRPALVQRRRTATGHEFALNEFGMAAKAALNGGAA